MKHARSKQLRGLDLKGVSHTNSPSRRKKMLQSRACTEDNFLSLQMVASKTTTSIKKSFPTFNLGEATDEQIGSGLQKENEANYLVMMPISSVRGKSASIFAEIDRGFY